MKSSQLPIAAEGRRLQISCALGSAVEVCRGPKDRTPEEEAFGVFVILQLVRASEVPWRVAVYPDRLHVMPAVFCRAGFDVESLTRLEWDGWGVLEPLAKERGLL